VSDGQTTRPSKAVAASSPSTSATKRWRRSERHEPDPIYLRLTFSLPWFRLEEGWNMAYSDKVVDLFNNPRNMFDDGLYERWSIHAASRLDFRGRTLP